MQMLGQVDITVCVCVYVCRSVHTICHLISFNDEPRKLYINISSIYRHR